MAIPEQYSKSHCLEVRIYFVHTKADPYWSNLIPRQQNKTACESPSTNTVSYRHIDAMLVFGFLSLIFFALADPSTDLMECLEGGEDLNA